MARHDEVPLEPVPHHVVASWPVGTLVENVALLDDGDLVVSVHSDRELVRVGRDGGRERLAAMPVPPTGLVVDGGRLFVTGGEIGTAPHAVYAVDPDGAVRRLLEVPGTVFLNGFTPARPGFGYCVDSIAGAVFEIDLAEATSREVLCHELLAKISDDPMVSGVNGLVLGDDTLWLTAPTGPWYCAPGWAATETAWTAPWRSRRSTCVGTTSRWTAPGTCTSPRMCITR
jgi:hypothetical protein